MRFTNFFRVGKLRLEDIKGHPSHSFISVEWVFPQGASLFILREKKKEFRLLFTAPELIQLPLDLKLRSTRGRDMAGNQAAKPGTQG